MAIKRRNKLHVGIESSSMSDIMFFLLLFFLIISTLANPNVIKIPLPKADQTDRTPKAHLTLSVTSDLHFFLDKDEVKKEGLEAELLKRTGELNDNTVVIRPAKDLDVQVLIDLLQMGLKHQIKFVIATQVG